MKPGAIMAATTEFYRSATDKLSSAVIRKQLDRLAEAPHRMFADVFEIELALDQIGERAR